MPRGLLCGTIGHLVQAHLRSEPLDDLGARSVGSVRTGTGRYIRFSINRVPYVSLVGRGVVKSLLEH